MVWDGFTGNENVNTNPKVQVVSKLSKVPEYFPRSLMTFQFKIFPVNVSSRPGNFPARRESLIDATDIFSPSGCRMLLKKKLSTSQEFLFIFYQIILWAELGDYDTA